MDDAALHSYLAPDEKLLWSGAPKKKFRFERKHLPLLLFMVPFCLFMFLPVIAILAPAPPAKPNTAAQIQSSSPQQAPAENPPQKPPPPPQQPPPQPQQMEPPAVGPQPGGAAGSGGGDSTGGNGGSGNGSGNTGGGGPAEPSPAPPMPPGLVRLAP